MGRKKDIKALQQEFPGAVTFVFGDSRKLSDALTALVRTGRKRATCAALHEYDDETPLPEPGQVAIAVDWDGYPTLVLETTEVRILRFCDVDEDFALAEGEDETLEGWRKGHRKYFKRNGGFDEAMLLVCERFRLVRDLARDGGG